MRAMDQGAIEGAMDGASGGSGRVEGAMDVASDGSQSNRTSDGCFKRLIRDQKRSDRWCERWIREL